MCMLGAFHVMNKNSLFYTNICYSFQLLKTDSRPYRTGSCHFCSHSVVSPPLLLSFLKSAFFFPLPFLCSVCVELAFFSTAVDAFYRHFLLLEAVLHFSFFHSQCTVYHMLITYSSQRRILVTGNVKG